MKIQHLLQLGLAGLGAAAISALACGDIGHPPAADAADTDAPAAAPSVPAGAVMFFELAACPDGWSELTTAQGRVIVGRPAGGLLGGTVGTALENLGDRRIDRVPAHMHPVDPPAAITGSSGAHDHAITVASAGAHAHSGTTATAGSHSHNVDTGHGGGTQSIAQWAGEETDPPIADFATGAAGAHTHTFTTTSDGAHLHTAVAANDGAHAHAVDIGPFVTAATGEASVDVTMPYVQLLACRKS